MHESVSQDKSYNGITHRSGIAPYCFTIVTTRHGVKASLPLVRRLGVNDVTDAEHALLDCLLQRRRLTFEARIDKNEAVLLHTPKHAVYGRGTTRIRESSAT